MSADCLTTPPKRASRRRLNSGTVESASIIKDRETAAPGVSAL